MMIAVVGPSGVGKDTVMEALAQDPRLSLVRRTITRDPEAGGEDYDPVTEAEFERMAEEGAFVLHWRAHGLRYGVPKAEAQGDRLVNLSRLVLTQAAEVFPAFMVLNLTASPQVLAKRLNARGRETAEEIEARLAKGDKPLPEGLRVVTIDNSGPLQDTVKQALAAIYPSGSRVT